MANDGVKTGDISNRPALSDQLIVMRNGSTGLQWVSDLATQLAGDGAVADKLTDLANNQVTGGITAATWPELAGVIGTVAKQGAQVLDADTGAHTDPVVGGTVPNAGSFNWSVSPQGWKRIGASGLAGKVNNTQTLGVLGLAQTSGSLGANPVVSVPAASPATTITGTATDQAVTPAGDKAALDARLSATKFVSMNPESGYAGAIVDSVGRACLLIGLDGTVTGKIRMGSASIGFTSLDTTITPLLGQAMPPESGFVYAITDAVGRVAFGIAADGSVTVRVSTLIGKSVGIGNLLDPLARQVVPKLTDVTPVKPDRWRQQTADIAVTTSSGDGSLWRHFPARALRHLRGLNKSGVSLDFRKSLGLLILGTSYAGTFSPGAYPSLNFKTYLLGPAVSAPSGSFAAGDYYLYANGTDVVSTGAFPGMNVGDALVYGSDGAWHIQPGPGVRGSRAKSAWWLITAAGSFDGVTYAVGDRILYISAQTGGGGFQYERWYRVDVAKGDLCYKGEFAPSGGLPTSPSNGEVYQASAAGAAGGFTWALGDYALYIDGGWQQLGNSAPVTFANGASISLPCIGDASEWEVRRTDKSASAVGVRLQAQVQLSPWRNQDFIWMLSDSMFGVSGTGNLVLLKSGRAGIVNSFGGSTSLQVLGMMEYEVSRLQDTYRGAILFAWHGQNNQPGISEFNAAQIREVSLAMYNLLGSRDGRACFLSVMGQLAYSWSGTRLVASQHEDQFNKTGELYLLKQWYEREFPGNCLHPYDIALAAAGSTPHLHFPGMTEAQVAATYGVLPLSSFNGSLPVAAASLVYKGTWSTTALPTGGTANDYYIRVGGTGTIGALLINVAGTWTEWTWDGTHPSPLLADTLSNAIIAFIAAKGW